MAQSADSTCLCEICIGGPGEYYCQQCDQLFCGNCKLSHLRAKISKNHTFFSGKNINKEEKRLCIEHEERFLFYCHDCDTPVCSSCSVQTHKGHLMNDLTKSALKLKFELIKIIESTITTSTSCIGKIEEDTKTYHQKTEAVNKTITEEGNYYKEFIDKKVHSFVKLVQDETQKALGSMSTATKVYLEILENCQQWQKNITEMETKSDVLLYKKLKHLKTDVDQIVSKQSLDTPRPSVSYTNKILSDTDIDNLFGELTFQHSADIKQHIQEDEKCKKNISYLKKEQDDARTKAGRHTQELNNASARMKEQEVLFSVERSSLEEKVEDLKYQLSHAKSNRLDSARYMTDDYNKEQLDQKDEEIVRLTRVVYSLDESSRRTNVCPNCESKNQHMYQYKAERDNLNEDKNRLEKHVAHLAGERNDLTRQLQKIQMEKNKFIELVKSLETQLKQLQNALNEAEQATKETKMMINNCREDKNAVKSTLLERELENDKLQCEKEQLNERLKMLKEHAEEQINKLKKKLKEKEKDLQQSKQINDELNKNLVEIERNRTEFTIRERNELIQQQKNNEILNKDNEALKTEMYELENKQAEEKKENIDIEHKFKLEINNLQIRNERLNEKFKEAERDLEETNSKSKEQQAIFNSKQSQFEKKIKALRSQIKSDEKLKSTEYGWSRSANPSRTHAYELEEEGFLDMNGWNRNPSSIQENYSSVGDRSDTEKENISLKSELTVALDSIEKLKQEYSDLSEKYETRKIATQMTIESLQREKDSLEQEKVYFRAKLDQIQSDVNRFKNEQVHQQDSSHGTIDNLLQQNRKLDKDRELFRAKILSLENDKVKLEDMLNKSNEDHKKLKDNVREKSNELRNSEARFRELADSKETSEVLNKIIENLEREKTDLNQRLQQYAEKIEDIPAQKRHMDKLQSDNDELNLRLQEYAAELEGMPSLKRRIENLQTDNAELEKRGKHKDGLLQKSESTVQKKQKDNKKLKTEIISQNQNYDTLKIEFESLKDKNLELDQRLRLNEAAGIKLRYNNPNIADLNDMNRPTSLAEKYSSLYTDEYTRAMEVIEDDMDEAASVKVMFGWLKSCYEWCHRLAKEQRDTLINRSIGFMNDHGGQKVILSDRCLIFVKEFQKKIAVESLAVVGQICHAKSITQQALSSENYIVKYIKKCSELCWMMQISDPPLYLNFDVNSGENLNKNDYNVFTKSGSRIDYLVWPVLYLHKTGPMLAKGVAQGK